MSMQYTAIFHGCKNDNFQMKIFDIFLIFAQNIDCGYTLEPPQRGGSNEYPLSMFWSKNKKKYVYPSKPHFFYIKVGCKGVFITWTCYPDGKFGNFLYRKYFSIYSQVDAFIARMSQKTVDMTLTVTRPLGSFAVLQVNIHLLVICCPNSLNVSENCQHDSYCHKTSGEFCCLTGKYTPTSNLLPQ